MQTKYGVLLAAFGLVVVSLWYTLQESMSQADQVPIFIPTSAVITSPEANFSIPARPALFGPFIPGRISGAYEDNQDNGGDGNDLRAPFSISGVSNEAKEGDSEGNDNDSDDSKIGGFTGSLSVVNSLACGKTDPSSTPREDLREKIALVYRGDCGFYEKILTLQEWGAVSVVVADNIPHRGLITMFTRNEIDIVHIPSVFVSKESYDLLKEVSVINIAAESGTSTLMDSIIFLLISPLCSMSLIYVLLVLQRRYRMLKDRAPKSFVESLPTRLWTESLYSDDDESSGEEAAEHNGEGAESREGAHKERRKSHWVSSGECIICLEDYIPGVSKVMKLPCGHEFHSECISKWLILRKKTCPICTKDVTDLEQSIETPNDETTPLMQADSSSPP